MKDHMKRRPRSTAGRKSVGVRELKAHAARIVREVREARASYVVTHRGRPVGVILPVDAAGNLPTAAEPGEQGGAWEAFVLAGRRLEARFATGVSGVRVLSDTRR